MRSVLFAFVVVALAGVVAGLAIAAVLQPKPFCYHQTVR
jgi:hypothetical protein